MAVKLTVEERSNYRLEATRRDSANLSAQTVTTERNYNKLANKPQIEGVTLEGNKTFAELGLVVDQELSLTSTNPVANKAVSQQGAHIAQVMENLALDVGANTRDIGTINNILPHIKQISIDGLGYDILAIFTEKQDDIITDVVFQLDDGSIDGYWLKVPSLDLVTAVIGDIDLQLQDLAINKANVSDIPTKTSDLENDGADGTSTYVEADELATVATSGSYNDLLNQPTIPAAQVNSDWNASSGVAEILNKPTIPEAPVNADWNAVSGLAEILNKPTIPAAQVNADWNANSGVAEILNKPTIPAAQVNADWNANSGVAQILNKPTIPIGIPSGGNAGQILKKTSATDYDANWADQTQYYPSGYSTTGADKQTKQIACSSWTATPNSYLHILLTHANTYSGKLYFSINAVNTYEVWINGAVSSATNYSLPAGSYIIYFDGSAFQVRTDGIIPASVNGTAARMPYGELDSTSTSTVMTATVPGITELKDGVMMLLYNGVVTSASGFTINVNGLGAKPCYNNMTLGNPVTPTNPTRDTTIFNINYAFIFVYSETLVSGGCWIGYRGYDANTNTIGYQLRTNSSTMKTADKFYRYRLLFTSADGTKWIPANTSTSTNATASRTPNTRAIDPFGEIVWYGTTTVIEANAAVTAAQLWQEYSGSYTAIGYSFNNTGAAQTMTSNAPIYIKCTPQADGSAIIDPTTPYTQTLPSTDDGKIYIYLGRAYSATNFEITMNHPVYYHDGTGIKLWTGGRQMPDPPAANGTYTLQAVVNDGAVTYSWI